MLRYLILVLTASTLLVNACEIIKNNEPLVDYQPRLVQTVPNGQKLILGDPSDIRGNYLYIVNVKGTPREMGKAYGELMRQELQDNLKRFYAYYADQVEAILEKKLPKFMAQSITGGAEKLLHKILDLNIRITRRYTNVRYIEEIKGIGEGVGTKGAARQVERLNIFPELIKAACTVAGVWGKATADGQTLHMRALDWDSKNLISKYPTVVVYHPSDQKLHKHANFGWAGFVGSMTGVSQYVSLGQKVWLPPKNSVKMTRYGNPWTYVIRDVLYEASNLKEALGILTKAHRTCAIHLGLGSATDHSFRMLEYSQTTLNNYDDTNYTHYAANHPKKAGIAYFDKHVQPSGDGCVGSVLTNPQFYGKWDAESFWRNLGLTHQTGDTQLVVFDLENKIAFVSYPAADQTTKAFARSPIKVDLKHLFASF